MQQAIITKLIISICNININNTKKYLTMISIVWEFLLLRANHCNLFLPQVCLCFAFIRVFFWVLWYSLLCYNLSTRAKHCSLFLPQVCLYFALIRVFIFCSFVIGIAMWQVVIESKSLQLVTSRSLFHLCFDQSFCSFVL